MISKSYIESNLKRMNYKFIMAHSSKEALFYAKMAILELCGWVEESMDEIILRHAIRNLNDVKNIDYIKNNISHTYGFHYNKNFKKMLIVLIGIVLYEKFEKSLDRVKFQRLKSELGSLTNKRNEEAHTHIKATRTINAPSVTLNQFQAIYEGLLDLECKLRSLKRFK